MSNQDQSSGSKLVGVAGLGLAAVGATHFVRPELFESITTPAFPNDTLRNTYINGGLETALGLGLAVRKTRPLAIAGLVAYSAYLAQAVVRNR
jgi:uncharacterized membrane protein